MFRTLPFAAVVVSAFMVLPAQALVWTFQDATFVDLELIDEDLGDEEDNILMLDSGVATGSFEFSPDAGTVGFVNITTSGTDAFNGLFDTVFEISIQSDEQLLSFSNSSIGTGDGAPLFVLLFEGPDFLTEAGGVVPLASGISNLRTCTGPCEDGLSRPPSESFGRGSITATVVPLPAPAGLLALGLAVLWRLRNGQSA